MAIYHGTKRIKLKPQNISHRDGFGKQSWSLRDHFSVFCWTCCGRLFTACPRRRPETVGPFKTQECAEIHTHTHSGKTCSAWLCQRQAKCPWTLLCGFSHPVRTSKVMWVESLNFPRAVAKCWTMAIVTLTMIAINSPGPRRNEMPRCAGVFLLLLLRWNLGL